MSGLARVAVLVDHPATRAGVEAAVDAASDLELVSGVASIEELWPILRDAQPHIVVVDVHGTGRSNADVSLEIGRVASAPAVVMYGSPADRQSASVAGALAGATAVVSRFSSTAVLIDTVRAATRSRRARPQVPWFARSQAAACLDPDDRPIFALRLAGEGPASIAQTLGLPYGAVLHRIKTIIAALESGPAGTPSATWAPGLG